MGAVYVHGVPFLNRYIWLSLSLFGGSALAEGQTAPAARGCVREWVRVEGGQPKVRWCGRELEAEQLLVPEARLLFARGGAGATFDLALAADARSKVAGGVAVGLFGLSLVVLIHPTPPGGTGAVGDWVLGITTILTAFGGAVGSLILHAIFSNEAIEHLHHAMDVLEQNSPRE